MRRAPIFSMFVFLFFGVKILAQTESVSSVDNSNSANVISYKVPSDFPVYSETGNITEDENNFLLAVREWIKRHPDEYLNYMNSGVDILKFRDEYKPHTSNENNVPNIINTQTKTTSNVNEKVVITQQEFDALPQHKKDYYKANPDLIEIK